MISSSGPKILNSSFGKAAEQGRDRFEFDERTGEIVSRAGRRRLEPRASAVLKALIDAKGVVISRGELLDRCWPSHSGSDEALTQAVAQVRRALAELAYPDAIQTLAKRGYRLTVLPHGATAAVSLPSRTHVMKWLLVAVAAAILLLLAVGPHSLRHGVRHLLGFGPEQHS